VAQAFSGIALKTGFCQGIEKTSGSVVSLVGLSAIKPHCTLRRLLIIGSSAVVQQASKRGAPKESWLEQMLARKPRMLVTVALANKMARIIWALLEENYRAPVAAKEGHWSPPRQLVHNLQLTSLDPLHALLGDALRCVSLQLLKQIIDHGNRLVPDGERDQLSVLAAVHVGMVAKQLLGQAIAATVDGLTPDQPREQVMKPCIQIDR
jgi:hypothetical protein